MYNDYELLYLAQENNEDAVNELRKKYNSLLYAKALSYSRSSHMDIKELLNETELAFYKAIDNYIDKNTFNTYLNKVIDNNLTNYIAKHNVTKNKILNESISYENNNERILELESNKYNPEVNLFNDYDYSSLRNKIIEVLTWEEELIFTLKEQNYTVLEISEITVFNSVVSVSIVLLLLVIFSLVVLTSILSADLKSLISNSILCSLS